MKIARLALLVLVIGSATVGWAYRTAVADPVIRFATVELLPSNNREKQLRLVLLSDIHVAAPDMPPKRLMSIVEQVNALRPDVVVIAGDFISDKPVAPEHFSFREAAAPLRGLQSRLGTFAVLGNHDHARGTAEGKAALRHAGIRILDNDAARAGPLAIGGLDDAFTRRDDLARTVRAMAAIGGEPILLSHSPDPFPDLPAAVKLMLSGHTHCGQISLPWLGAVSYMSKHGDKYACGVVVERGRTLVVSAGLGTSLLPLRLGAVPDMWVVTVTKRDTSAIRAAAPPVSAPRTH